MEKDEEVASKILKEVLGYKIKLDMYPSRKSLEEQYKKLAECKGYLERVVEIFTKILVSENSIQVMLSTAENEYNLKFKTFITSDDPEIRNQKNQDLREAIVELRLQKLKSNIESLEIKLLKIKVLREIVKSKMDDLELTLDTISRQITVLEHVLGLKPGEVSPPERMRLHNV